MSDTHREKTPKEVYKEGFAFEKKARTLRPGDERNTLLIQASAMYQAASEGLERQRKYGSAENFFKRSKRVYEEVTSHEEYHSAKRISKINRKRLINIGKYLQRREDRHGGLEKATGVASIIGLIGGLFFLSTNITGNTIGTLSNQTSSITGIILLLAGLVGIFIWFKKR